MDGYDVAIGPTGDPGRDHGRGHASWIVQREDADASPIHGGGEGLAHAHIVERGHCCPKPVVVGRERLDLAQEWTEIPVVGDPRGVETADRRVVDVALHECLDFTGAVKVGDDGDGCDGRWSRPVAFVGLQGHRAGGGRRESIAAAGHEVVAGQDGRRRVADAGRNDAERRAGDDGRKVGGRPQQIDHDIVGGIVGPHADILHCAPARDVVASADDVEQQRDQWGWCVGVDEPKPTADHIAGTQRGPVGERQIGTDVEHHAPAIRLDPPRLGQRRLEPPIVVEGGDRLVQLGDERSAARIPGRCRIQGGGLAEQDARIGAGGRRRLSAGADERRDREQGRDWQEGPATHARSIRAVGRRPVRAARAGPPTGEEMRPHGPHRRGNDV